MARLNFCMLKSRSRDFRRLWSYSTGFYAVWVAHVGRRMGFLDILSNEPMTAQELATSSRLFLPAVETWCSAAAAYRFVMKGPGGKLRLASGMKSLLTDKKHPDYLGGQFSYLALRSLEYGALDDLFRSGKTKSMSNTFDAIEEATHWDHYSLLRAIRKDKRLHRLLTNRCNFADIGCGTGSLIVKLCKEYPNSVYHGIDPSDVALLTARQNLNEDQATIEKMKAEEMHFSKEFDIVYLGESLYASSNKQAVLTNCYRSLKEAGTVIIIEGLVPARMVTESDLIISGMQLDFALQGYKFMTKRELGGLLKTAGFKKVAFNPLGGAVFLTCARK